MDGAASGKFTKADQTVTYIYQKDVQKAGNVTVKYEDETGNEIVKAEILTGKIGEKYQTKQKAITGYVFQKMDGSASGKFTDKEQTVTYVYTKHTDTNADVTVQYVDEKSQEIAKTETKHGKIGEKYTTEQKMIKGYTFKEVKGKTSGTFTDQAQRVIYIYTKDGDVNHVVNPDAPNDAGTITNLIHSLLPQTAAQKITLIGMISVILATLAGVIVWKKRK